MAPPHALLVAHWGKEGAAALSLPTKEYFQSSAWVEEKPPSPKKAASGENDTTEIQSVRSGSDFWADGRGRTPSSSAFFSATYVSDAVNDGRFGSPRPLRTVGKSRQYQTEEEDGYDSQGTEVPDNDDDGIIDEVGAQDAFVAGMIYALSRRLLPGSPYTPSWTGKGSDFPSPESEHGRWRLEECLR